MANLFEIEQEINTLLNSSQFKDYAPNGIQIEGASEVHHIVSAVSASLTTIEAAIALNAQMLLVHHGYFWKGEQAHLTGVKFKRIQKIIQNNLSLVAYHLPLDAHVDLGNNAELGKLLNIKNAQASIADPFIWTGEFESALSASELNTHMAKQMGRPVLILGPTQSVRKVAWCTGGGADFFEKAAALGIDAFITGEAAERHYHQANDLGVNLIIAGHHATERGGVRALGQYLSERMGVKHTFVDEENPL